MAYADPVDIMKDSKGNLITIGSRVTLTGRINNMFEGGQLKIELEPESPYADFIPAGNNQVTKI